MIQGSPARISEATVASAAIVTLPKADLIFVTGSTSIDTISGMFINAGYIIHIVPLDGAVSTTTNGNIAVAVAMPQNRATTLVYSRSTAKWYPGAIS